MLIQNLNFEIDIKKYFKWLVAVESLTIAMLFFSEIFSLAFFLTFFFPFIIFLVPEISFAVALTDNILLKVLSDAVPTGLPFPQLIAYFLLISFSIFFYLSRKSDQYEFIDSRLHQIVIAIILLLIFGLFFSTNRSYGATKILFYLIYNLTMFFIPSLYVNDLRGIKRIIIIGYILGIILGLISFLVKADTVVQFLRFRPSESVNPIFLSRSLGVSIICGIFLLVKSKQLYTKFLILLSYIILLPPMIWSGSRGPFIGVLVLALGFYFLQPAKPLSKKILISLVTLTSAVLLIIYTTNTISTRISAPITQEASSAFRVLAWLVAIQNFLSSPLIGIGTGSYLMEAPWQNFIYPHNLILELACENGILGLILILLFIGQAIRYGLSNIRDYAATNESSGLQLSVVSICLFLFGLWNAMFSGDISNNSLVWFAGGLISALSLTTKVKRVKKNG
ncbi:MAG: O-antigen ligase family protein [Candidatus Zhuqueibacterota bacterium]